MGTALADKRARGRFPGRIDGTEPPPARVPGRLPLELVALAALTVMAVWLRHLPLGAPFWIDEGLSVGIASHPLGEIPHLLRLDGSPPLYYVLLHTWMAWFGSSESTTHALSLTCALLAVPAGWWAARPFGTPAALLCAAILALDPFVGLYADETRMYTLVLLLGLLATGAFVRAFVDSRRPYAALLAVLLAALMYTHAWGLFLAAALGICWLVLLAFAPDRTRTAIDGAIAFGGALVLFAPWLPTLAYQTAHTGAPWSHRPSGTSLVNALSRMLGGRQPELILLVAGIGLLAETLRAGRGRVRRGGPVLLLGAGLTLLLAWEWSRTHEPAWALRYFVVVLAPLAVALAVGLGRAPLVGVAAVVAVFALSWHGHPPTRQLKHKSNVATVARRLEHRLPRGTLVLSVQPEQVSNLAYYLPPGMRFMTPLGRTSDPGVMDWRDAMHRLRVTTYDRVVPHAVRSLPVRHRLLLVNPVFKSADSPWTVRLKHLARSWERHLRHSRYLRIRRVIKPVRPSSRSSVKAILFERRAHVVG